LPQQNSLLSSVTIILDKDAVSLATDCGLQDKTNDLCAVLVCDQASHITNIGYRLAGGLLVLLSQIHFLSKQNVGFVS
jgi:hypothetical protein